MIIKDPGIQYLFISSKSKIAVYEERTRIICIGIIFGTIHKILK